jgi:hypothetical protein
MQQFVVPRTSGRRQRHGEQRSATIDVRGLSLAVENFNRHRPWLLASLSSDLLFVEVLDKLVAEFGSPAAVGVVKAASTVKRTPMSAASLCRTYLECLLGGLGLLGAAGVACSGGWRDVGGAMVMVTSRAVCLLERATRGCEGGHRRLFCGRTRERGNSVFC